MAYRKPQRGDRLATVAKRLDAGSGRVAIVPWYVHQVDPDDGTPAPGWYVMLGDVDAPVYLGHNAYDAERALRRHLSQEPAR